MDNDEKKDSALSPFLPALPSRKGDMFLTASGGSGPWSPDHATKEYVDEQVKKLPPARMHEKKEDCTEMRVFAVFPHAVDPTSFVADVGTHVFDAFEHAWEEILNPSWGNRAIYHAHVCTQKIIIGQYHMLLTEKVMGWNLLVPDDINVLVMEKALLGIHNVSRLQDGDSWFSQMAQRLMDVQRKKDNGEEMDPLEYAICCLPKKHSKALIEKFNWLSQEVTSLRAQMQVELEKERNRLKSESERTEFLRQAAAGVAVPVMGKDAIEEFRQLIKERFTDKGRTPTYAELESIRGLAEHSVTNPHSILRKQEPPTHRGGLLESSEFSRGGRFGNEKT